MRRPTHRHRALSFSSFTLALLLSLAATRAQAQPCAVDADCTAGNWCNETAGVCTATLVNGAPMPTDSAHSNPTLNGMCSNGAAVLVCQSGVCDVDNKCGYQNSDGVCNASNATVVCRSQVCDLDGQCGYADGDGPCTVGTGATVCRSGVCSSDDFCEPSGGCNVDADCTGGNWCDESTHTCTSKLVNGIAIPSDPSHADPTLNGLCSSDAGALVCLSGVCDSVDNKCGYADGDGSCNAGNAATVCRSGVCSSDGSCEPSGGCNVDADCTGGNWCDESTHTCTPQLVNGVTLPSDPAHSSPTLNGLCNTDAGALVCLSGVCDDADNKCGYADGDGSCNAGNGATVCRSGLCSGNGTCQPASGCNVDADCTGGDWCNESAHTCAAPLANGTLIPTDSAHSNPTLDGTCTPDAGMLVCLSAVCDTNDNQCGYANGDGACNAGNAATVCRSGACSSNGTCMAAGGCNVDGDCANGQWCDESAHSCTAPLANGMSLPSDPAHSDPTLDGSCSADAAALVCASGVCDANDNECGYADGDGPCTAGNGATVCRSGMCGGDGLCVASGGCDVDADCTSPMWCNEATHSCTAPLANGQPLPSDPTHSDPSLDGTCAAGAALLVCVSGVCDSNDNECGYANGDGPCTVNNGAAVCRSGTCSNNGTCIAAGSCAVNADCSSASLPVCDTMTQQCSAAPKSGGACAVDPHAPGGDALALGLALVLLALAARERRRAARRS